MQTKLVSLIITASLAAAAPAQTPAHEWRFEGNGLDSQSLAPGSLGQNITFASAGVPAPLGQAMVVGANGTDPNNVIRVQEADVVGFSTGDFALAAWVKRTGFDANNDGIADAQDSSDRGWQLHFNGNDQIQFRMDDGSGPDLTAPSSSTITDTDWHLIVVSVDRDDPPGAKFYIDGVLDSEHDPTAVDGDLYPNQNLWLGGMNDNGSQGLNGEMARFQIFLQDLSTTEIAALYTAGSATHQYAFDADGTDEVGIANGVVGANVLFDATGVPTQLGSAAVFSGNGNDSANRVDVPVGTFTKPGLGDFSFSCWVRRDNVTATSDGLFDCFDTISGIQTQFLSSNLIRARLVDTSGNAVSIETLSTITDSQWHHLLFSVDRDQADGARWYIDGVLDSISDPTSLASPITPDQDLRIGTVNSNQINGSIARLAFYNTALSATDALNLADLDGDDISFADDSCLDEDDNLDADGDGVADFCDICTGPDNIDSDGDGVCDSLDICPGGDDALDEDGDGTPDGCDICFGADNIDSDADGICDSLDICPGGDDTLDEDLDAQIQAIPAGWISGTIHDDNGAPLQCSVTCDGASAKPIDRSDAITGKLELLGAPVGETAQVFITHPSRPAVALRLEVPVIQTASDHDVGVIVYDPPASNAFLDLSITHSNEKVVTLISTDGVHSLSYLIGPDNKAASSDTEFGNNPEIPSGSYFVMPGILGDSPLDSILFDAFRSGDTQSLTAAGVPLLTVLDGETVTGTYSEAAISASYESVNAIE